MQPPRDQPMRVPRHRPMRPARARQRKHASLAALTFSLLLSSTVAWAERPVVFRWIDENGIPHYTTQRGRIPSEFSESVTQIGQPGVASPSDAPSTSVGSLPPVPTPSPATPSAPAAPTTPSVSSAPPIAPPPTAVAPAPTAKPSGPRVMPEGEFEEPPLGSKGTATPPAPAPVSAPNAKNTPSERAPSTDVAAPPPGYSRDATPEPEASAVPNSEVNAEPMRTEPEPVVTRAEPPPVAAQPEPAPVAKEVEPRPAVSVAPLAPADAADLDTRIASLEEQVSKDQAAIQNILSQPREADGPRVAERPDFREIALRLPGLQANLKVLREQRARQSGP